MTTPTPTQRAILTKAAELEVQRQRAAERGDDVAARSLESDIRHLWDRWKALEDGQSEGDPG